MTLPSRAKTIAAIVAAFAAVFVIFGGLTLGYSLISAAVLAVVGALFGAVAAPEIDPKLLRYPTLWQIAFSTIGCLLLAVFLGADAEGYALAVLAGLILGYIAPYWIKHIRAP